VFISRLYGRIIRENLVAYRTLRASLGCEEQDSECESYRYSQ